MIALLLRILLIILPLAVSSAAAGDSEYYRQRREKLFSMLGAREAVIIPGAWEKELETFRQSNNFYYFTGIEQPGLVLIVSPASRSREVLFLPARNLEDGSVSEAWTGAKLGPGNATQQATGIAKAAEKGTLETMLASLAGQIDKIYFDFVPSALNGPRSGAEIMLDQIKGRYPHLEIALLGHLTDSLRTVKDSVELATLQQAVDITGEALTEAISTVRPGMFEYEVEAMIEYGFHKRGSQRPGFPSIVGSGPNSVVLHYNENRRQTEPGELLLMDVGAEFDYYTGDITRTVPVDGRFAERQREVYETVLAAQMAAIEAVKPGVTLRTVHAAAKKVIDEAGFGEFFIHYTSHFLGMDVHDVGSRDEPLRPGMVITVEPGIYLPDENLGIRIEDDVLVTAEGRKVLSLNIPKKVDDIESLMQQND